MKRQVRVSHSPRKRILIHPERNSQPRTPLSPGRPSSPGSFIISPTQLTGISFDEGTRLAGFTVKGWRASPSKATLLPGERVGRTLSACDDGQLGALTAGGLPTSAVRPVFVVAQRAPGCRLSRDAVASDNRVCRTHVPLKDNRHKDDLERSSLCRSLLLYVPRHRPEPTLVRGPPRLRCAFTQPGHWAVVFEGPVLTTVGLARAGPLDVVPSRAVSPRWAHLCGRVLCRHCALLSVIAIFERLRPTIL